jgi:diacylglycerol kinase (ATP)
METFSSTQTFEHILVILNPSSGQRDVSESRQSIEKVLRTRNITFDLRLTEGKDDALNWAKAAKEEGYDAVVVAGGDGTMMEALNGLLKAKSDLPLLVVPLGTANGLARTLKLPLEPGTALEAALNGATLTFDVGYVVQRDHYFLLFAGAGYDAQVIKEADRKQKDKYGFMAYIYAAFKQLGKRRNQRMTLRLDGKPLRLYAHSVVVLNANEFVLAGIPIGPKANAKDGKFDIVVLRDPSAWGTFREVLGLLIHRLQPKPQPVLQASSLVIETLRPLPFQTDGDEMGETPLEIEVKPNAATFAVPKAYLEAVEKESNA